MAGGRPRKSATLHIVGGNASKLSNTEIAARLDSQRTAEESCLPPVTQQVAANPVALAFWNERGPLLVQHGLMNNLFARAFERYCLNFATWVKASEKLNGARNPEVDTTPNGFRQMSVWLQIQSNMQAKLDSFEKNFGLTPEAWARMRSAANQGDLFKPDQPQPQTANAAQRHFD